MKPRRPIGFVIWAVVTVSYLAYANYYGIRIIDAFSSSRVQHAGAPVAGVHHK